jgi:hypothetical protein
VQCAAVGRHVLVTLGRDERLDDRGRLVAAVPGGRWVRGRRRHCEAAAAAAAAAAASGSGSGKGRRDKEQTD